MQLAYSSKIMTKLEKLLNRFLAKLKDFTWAELVKILQHFGYKQISFGKTGGSRIRFVHSSYPPIIMHRPHPRPVLKNYQIEAIIHLLKQERLL